MSAKTQFPSKITVKTCGFDSEVLTEIVKGSKGQVHVLRIAGMVKSSESKESTLGEYREFHGQFEAINEVTGQRYRSMKLIVPAIAQSCVDEMVSAGKSEDDGAIAQIGLDILVEAYKPQNKNGMPYRFAVAPLVESKGDALSMLLDSFDKPQLTDGKRKK